MRRLRDRIDSARYSWRVARFRRPGLRGLPMALSGGAVELFGSGDPTITMTTTTATVLAGRLVEVSGNRSIAPAGATSRKVMGVAKQSASAIGDKVAVATGGAWMIVAQGAIAAGDDVGSGAAGDGRVSTIAAAGAAYVQAEANATRAIVGIALAAAADGAECPVLLRLA